MVISVVVATDSTGVLTQDAAALRGAAASSVGLLPNRVGKDMRHAGGLVEHRPGSKDNAHLKMTVIAIFFAKNTLHYLASISRSQSMYRNLERR